MIRNKVIAYNDEKKGIIRYLTAQKSFSYYAKTQNSSSLKGTTASDSPFTNDVSEKSNWHSEDEENSWISIKIKHVYLSVDSYVLRSTYNYPISWNLQGLNRMKTWENISVIRDDRSLQNWAFGKWETDVKDYFDEFRFVQIGTRVRTDNDPNDYCFELIYIEFFGSIIKKISITKNCKRQQHTYDILMLLCCTLCAS